MDLNESRRALAASALFRGFKPADIELILMLCEEAIYRSGDYVFREGDPGNALYLIVHGQVEVVLEPHGPGERPIPVAVLGPQDSFGEVTLVEDNVQRTDAVRCRTDAQLIRMPRDRLLQLCHDYPGIGFQVMHRLAAEMAAKLRASNVSIREYDLFTHPTYSAEPATS